MLSELEAAGGDVETLQALAQGDAAAFTEALKALGFTKLGKRVELKKALLAAPARAGGASAAAAPAPAPAPAPAAPLPLEQRPASERAAVFFFRSFG